ncbi:hypothetical protein A3Q56_08476 [Intoshia linei]|uniref:Uncharacterized protein n=1 Tax=Intoshia linei TaxID=1819745 RepID=A0A177AP52_9BILA|nr:hypothetical protein A3Q56_08476 [Intoshia linei]
MQAGCNCQKRKCLLCNPIIRDNTIVLPSKYKKKIMKQFSKQGKINGPMASNYQPVNQASQQINQNQYPQYMQNPQMQPMQSIQPMQQIPSMQPMQQMQSMQPAQQMSPFPNYPQHFESMDQSNYYGQPNEQYVYVDPNNPNYQDNQIDQYTNQFYYN